MFLKVSPLTTFKIRLWDDIEVMVPFKVHGTICVLAIHGLVANEEFQKLFQINKEQNNQAWIKRNGEFPRLATGKAESWKQQLRLADYLGITVPQRVFSAGLRSGVPLEVGGGLESIPEGGNEAQVTEKLSTEAMMEELRRRGIPISEAQETGVAADGEAEE